MNPTPHIFVLGSFVVGVTIRVQRPPARGETLLGDAFDLGPGGKGTNQAVAIARQGGRVSLLACVGKDRFASLARELLQAEGLAPTWLHELEALNTGVGFVTLLPDGENTIVLHPGANACMTLEMVDGAAEALASAAVVLAQLEVPIAVAEHALAQGRAAGSLTILNPAPGRLLPRSLLMQVDVLTPNETEARLLLGAAPDADIPVEDLAEGLLGLGVRAVVITRGAAGAFVADGDGRRNIPSRRMRPVDSTGAGDCFNGTLALELGRGRSLDEAVRRAVLAGAYATQFLGGIPGLPTTAELDAFMASRGTEVA